MSVEKEDVLYIILVMILGLVELKVQTNFVLMVEWKVLIILYMNYSHVINFFGLFLADKLIKLIVVELNKYN